VTGHHGPHAAVATTAGPNPLRMLWITAAWGACFVAIRWGLRDAPVLWFAALRAVIAGAALLALARVQRRPTPRGRRSWTLIAALGLVNVTIAFAAMFAGVAGLATGVAAVLANAQPLLILLPASWLYGEEVTLRTSVALAVGFVGLLVVALPGGGGRGAYLSLLAAAAITGGTLLARRLGDMDILVVSAWHFLIGGGALVVLAAAAEGVPRVAWTPRFVLVLAFLALIGSAATFVAWFTEARRSRLDILSGWTLLTPVVGIGLAAVMLGERPTGWSAVGLSAVLVALWLILRPVGRKPASVSASVGDRSSAGPPASGRRTARP
jgi:probable blue pigment (indigoidine) exporter